MFFVDNIILIYHKDNFYEAFPYERYGRIEVVSRN